MNGGDLIAEVLKAHGVRFLFTLCGGHISPILVGCKQRGIRVIDVRNEATAVFAADAVARLSGVPGVAAVTAGPGVTNTITAIQNAKMAQSPLVLLGGSTATALKGRGALQDIDQNSVLKPIVKRVTVVKKVRDLVPVIRKAFQIAQSGVPGPVFVECPIDLLYDEALIRQWYGIKTQGGKSLQDKVLKFYLNYHVNRLFSGKETPVPKTPLSVKSRSIPISKVNKVVSKLENSCKPLMLIGSQAMLHVKKTESLVKAVEALGIPVYLSGMARGLLGKDHPLHMRHKRRQALKEADLVILCGVPCDFRLDYGRHIRRNSDLISANLNPAELKLNRRPNLAVGGSPDSFLMQLAADFKSGLSYDDWLTVLQQRDKEREQEIEAFASDRTDKINPVQLCRQIEQCLPENTILVADGGDFVATASYIVKPPGPLTWLDPGVFGTLGVGAGFALGAKLVHPESEVWILFGDGAVGYSLSEFDTFVRHNLPVIAVVGNDACWSQIAREQVDMLKDDVGTVLNPASYHAVMQALGGKGTDVEKNQEIADTLEEARDAAKEGTPVLVNAHIGKTDFRKGSISM